MKSKRTRFIAAAAVIAIAVGLVVLLGGRKAPVRQGNLLTNGDFAVIADNGLPEGWYTDAYIQTVGYTEYSAVSGEARIVNYALNDARFAQDVAVQPDTLYCLSGFVRADATGGLGANVSVSGIYAFSESVYDSPDEWVEVRLYGRTGPSQNEVMVYARLGGYSGEAAGTAWFKDIKLEQVESVPPEYVALQWYSSSAPAQSAAYDEPAPSWPWLLCAAAVYLAACFLLRGWVFSSGIQQKKRGWLALSGLLLAAAALRVILAAKVPGYGVDIGCFTAWANAMAGGGAANFYSSGMFCDYPPGYILVLGLLGKFGEWLGTGATEFLVKLPSIVCDLAAAALLYAFAKKRVPQRAAFAIAALYAFNPVALVSGAAWGQSDSVMALCVLLVVVLAMDDRWLLALPAYMLAVLMKPQALMFGPLGLVALVVTLIRRKNVKLLIQALGGLVLALALAAAVILPFSENMEDPWWFVSLYANTMGYYANATVNACNLYFLFGKNWIGVEAAADWYIRLCAALLLTGGCLFGLVRGGALRRDTRSFIALIVLVAGALALCLPLGWTLSSLGTAVIALSVLLCAWLYLAGGELRHLPLLGALLLMLLCSLGVMMHERYLFAAVLLLALACALERDARVYILFALLTACVFLNVGVVLDRGVRIGGVDGHLSAPAFGITSDSAALEYIVSAVNCLLAGYAGYAAYSLCLEGKRVALAAAETAEEEAPQAADGAALRAIEHPHPAARMKGADWLLMLGVTAIYAVAALTNLGATTAPQTGWLSTAQEDTAVLDLGETREMNLLYYGGVQNRSNDFAVYVSDDGVTWSDPYWAQLREGDCFKWQYLGEISYSLEATYNGGTIRGGGSWISREEASRYIAGASGEHWSTYYYSNKVQYFQIEYPSADGNAVYSLTVNYTTAPVVLTGRYIKIEAENIATSLFEVVLRDPETQEVFPAVAQSESGAALCDEPYAFSGEPGWYNSTYFDEIYHARTGYEHYLALHGDSTYYPYETSHPPLGKVFMAFSISIFGMTPFGWRFAGALAGILMLPGMYLLGKLLTKRRLTAFAAMFLMAVDCMHFTQTRIATIDSFVVLFIIWAFAFMVYYVRMDYWNKPLWKTLVPLALSGLFMGLAVASKWTGCYAGVGLAVLFFWSVYRRVRQGLAARAVMEEEREKKEAEKENEQEAKPEEAEVMSPRLALAAKEAWKRPLITVALCFVFFIAVPALIYYCSYIPYFLPSGGVSVKRIIQAAEGMFSYHSTPGLGMDHYFYSPWYEWPVIAKPMWYYSTSYHPAGSTETIAAMGNPAVWWGGLLGLAAVLAIWLARHFRRDGLHLHTRSDDLRPAILIISFAAQFLPWMLVPRGTYIYHYFPSVPFIILCVALCFDLLLDVTDGDTKAKRIGKKALLCILGVYLLAALGLFIAFFPYASGVMTSMRWLRAMQWFPSWLYY
ncbi:MAG: glycosyltransferase family 39 protein [Clostridia bacterium]|nr:glycosyltransferase family 39 protein [Clostridia bacterium]